MCSQVFGTHRGKLLVLALRRTVLLHARHCGGCGAPAHELSTAEDSEGSAGVIEQSELLAPLQRSLMRALLIPPPLIPS